MVIAFTYEIKKILVVDDEPSILYSLAKTLQDDQIEVKTVNKSSYTIEEIRRCVYNLYFLDLYLPDMHAVEVMMKIKELSLEIKILAVSVSCIDDGFKELIQKKCLSFHPKPLRIYVF